MNFREYLLRILYNKTMCINIWTAAVFIECEEEWKGKVRTWNILLLYSLAY